MLPPLFLLSFFLSLREKPEKKKKKLQFDRKHSQKNKMETGGARSGEGLVEEGGHKQKKN